MEIWKPRPALGWAQPVADLLSTALVAALYWRASRKLFTTAD